MEQDQQQRQGQFSVTPETNPIKKTIVISLVVLFLLIIVGAVGFSFYKNLKPSKPNNVIQQHEPKHTNAGVNNEFLQELNTIKVAIEQHLKALKQSHAKVNNTESAQLLIKIQASISEFERGALNDNKNIKGSMSQLKQLITRSNSEITARIKQLNQKSKTNETAKIEYPFTLWSIDLWDGVPQATIKNNAKTSIVNTGDTRLGWKITAIDFDKEKIEITQNGKNLILEMLR